eukprot:CAMPEP_0171158374 /NCGR_PEP_ID=MMETSP0790-20130122/2471_1 /TAXON_ID=2925 /ORGANISM="Alexandrium catenella, Strain OF101" /LENGTH=70 /DNA_ID=CAMNT_0011622799 /DNA_START=220 /DNA_END=429 /DNA_ORIENTATION=-
MDALVQRGVADKKAADPAAGAPCPHVCGGRCALGLVLCLACVVWQMQGHADPYFVREEHALKQRSQACLE